MSKRSDLAVMYDRSQPGLRTIWALDDYIAATEHHEAVNSWAELLDELELLYRDGVELRELHTITDGNKRTGPVIAGLPPTAEVLQAFKAAMPTLRTWWIRGPDIGRNRELLKELVMQSQLRVACHCEVAGTGHRRVPRWVPWFSGMHLPGFWKQPRLVGYTTTELNNGIDPQYHPRDDELPWVLTSTIDVPKGIWKAVVRYPTPKFIVRGQT